MSTALPVLTAQDFASDQEVRWCPGCGDYAILAQFKKVLASLDMPREKMVLVSGIGCSSRLPYYINAYGFHTIHGRAPAFATGLKLANPDLQVWVITGDGDGLSIGAGHLLHALRRNVDLKILLFNNEVFGLTRGQYSPTSRNGTRTRSSPNGSLDQPFRPLSLALAAEATFVARTIDVEVGHLTEVLRRAALHRGSAFVEIYQNCKIFNDGVFEYTTDKNTKADSTLFLEQGKPLVFGKDRNQGIRCLGQQLAVTPLGNGVPIDDLVHHDEQAEDPGLAFLLSRMQGPTLPEVFGVLRAVEKPTFDGQVLDQLDQIQKLRGKGKLEELLQGDDSWTVA